MAPPRDRRPGFSRRAQYSLFLGYVVAVAGCVAAVMLVALSTFDPPAFAVLRSGAAELTTPLSSAGATIGRGIAGTPDAVSSYFGIRQENARLRREVTETRRVLMRARALSYDNHRLKALLRLRERVSVAVVAARLVSSTASSTRRFAVLNAGSWQGVRSGQPVTGPEGLIGRVVETGADTARVLLITDPESVVPVRRTRDGLPALAAGRGDGLIDIRSVASVNGDFAAGDVFVTSGTGGIYAPDVPVARIVRHARDIALARSFAQPDTLDFAFVQQAFMPPPPQRAPLPIPAPPHSPRAGRAKP